MRACFALIPFLAACASAGGEAASDGGTGSVDGATRADGAPAVADAASSACDDALSALAFDFESGDEGFVHGRMPEVANSTVSWTYDHWERGSAAIACDSGDSCFGTHLNGNYIQCQRAYLVSPPIDLSACAGRSVELLFEHNYDFWTGDFNSQTWFDGGLVEISGDGGSTWQPAGLSYPGTIAINPDMGSSYSCIENQNFYVHGKPGFVGSSSGWNSEVLSIPIELNTVTFQIRFVYASGVSSETIDQAASMAGTAPGWYVDALRFQ